MRVLNDIMAEQIASRLNDVLGRVDPVVLERPVTWAYAEIDGKPVRQIVVDDAPIGGTWCGRSQVMTYAVKEGKTWAWVDGDLSYIVANMSRVVADWLRWAKGPELDATEADRQLIIYLLDELSRKVIATNECMPDVTRVESTEFGRPQAPGNAGLMPEKSANSEGVRANSAELFPEGTNGMNPDVVKLAELLRSELNKKAPTRRKLEIARELTGETKGREGSAQSLLAQIRKYKTKGKINL